MYLYCPFVAKSLLDLICCSILHVGWLLFLFLSFWLKYGRLEVLVGANKTQPDCLFGGRSVILYRTRPPPPTPNNSPNILSNRSPYHIWQYWTQSPSKIICNLLAPTGALYVMVSLCISHFLRF